MVPCLHPPAASCPTDAHLSMMPFIRMALFQSFRVDLPARCTNSLGLMTCSSYCGGDRAEQSGCASRPLPLHLTGQECGRGRVPPGQDAAEADMAHRAAAACSQSHTEPRVQRPQRRAGAALVRPGVALLPAPGWPPAAAGRDTLQARAQMGLAHLRTDFHADSNITHHMEGSCTGPTHLPKQPSVTRVSVSVWSRDGPLCSQALGLLLPPQLERGWPKKVSYPIQSVQGVAWDPEDQNETAIAWEASSPGWVRQQVSANLDALRTQPGHQAQSATALPPSRVVGHGQRGQPRIPPRGPSPTSPSSCPFSHRVQGDTQSCAQPAGRQHSPGRWSPEPCDPTHTPTGCSHMVDPY